MNIVFLGAPGAGKGTLASMVSKKHGFAHIAPGNIFREEIKSKSKLGMKVKSLIDSGRLVSDEITSKMIQSYVKKNNVFDGYPRTLEQAKSLDKFAKPDLVVLFEVSEKIIVERLGGRWTCPDCQAVYHVKNIPPKSEGYCDRCKIKLIQRKDDMPEVIKQRFMEFNKKTAPLIELYRKRNILKLIDGNGTPDEVYAEVEMAVFG